MARVLHAAWASGVRFDGWSEHFRYDLWMKAFETAGIPKGSYLREYDINEILPWDVLDASITKRFLQIELIKAKKEWRTEDCKWGHCYACGVPGNGEDTVLAKSMVGVSLPPHPGPLPGGEGVREGDAAAYRDVANEAGYPQKAMPDQACSQRHTDSPPKSGAIQPKTGDQMGMPVSSVTMKKSATVQWITRERSLWRTRSSPTAKFSRSRPNSTMTAGAFA
jgi:hypothetical protein